MFINESSLIEALMNYESFARNGEIGIEEYATLATGDERDAAELAASIRYGSELEKRGFRLFRAHIDRVPHNALEWERDGGTLYYVMKVH